MSIARASCPGGMVRGKAYRPGVADGDVNLRNPHMLHIPNGPSLVDYDRYSIL